ncbi:DUF397 domain-containing protein [Streptomyces alkaliphilus]|uniref:DUF397 domain-containing protein n=1 Tax=Streptomyces alkaliphilus TaxID=1472722 RepID=UPI00117D5688|nr:DUF397 domain-containing protein [Streptomyces alkaliphilus]MQS07080.1 DUF397 domain-containing protein [Streptomyces alkaliphilus]
MTGTELGWFKSSYSSGSGDDCVEVAMSWRKSTYSSSGSGDCVEVATCPEVIHVRDSKAVDGPYFTVGAAAWAQFVDLATHA